MLGNRTRQTRSHSDLDGFNRLTPDWGDPLISGRHGFIHSGSVEAVHFDCFGSIVEGGLARIRAKARERS